MSRWQTVQCETMGIGPDPKGEVLLDTIRPQLFQLQGSTYDGKYHELKKKSISMLFRLQNQSNSNLLSVMYATTTLNILSLEIGCASSVHQC